MNDQQIERLKAAGLSRADAVTFRVLAVLAAASAVVALGTGIAAVAGTLGGDTVTATLFLAEPLSPPVNPAVVTAQAEEAIVTASAVSGGLRALLAAGAAIGSLIAAIVGVTLALFLWRLAQGRPFHRSLFAATLTAGLAMSLGGLIGAFAVGFGAMQLAFEVDPAGEVFVPGFSFDPTVMIVGFIVLAIAFVFRAGTRLARDTEGLV